MPRKDKSKSVTWNLVQQIKEREHESIAGCNCVRVLNSREKIVNYRADDSHTLPCAIKLHRISSSEVCRLVCYFIFLNSARASALRSTSQTSRVIYNPEIVSVKLTLNSQIKSDFFSLEVMQQNNFNLYIDRNIIHKRVF